MVYMSSSPCVGCAWRPSPALITATPGFTWRAMRWAAPDCEWRTTNISASIACRLYTVSSSVSPFEVEETPALRLITSAERRLAAISKVVRVRVEPSKNTLKIDLPRRIGTFFTSRSLTDPNWSAVSRMCRISSALKPSVVSRWRSLPSAPTCRLALGFSVMGYSGSWALHRRQPQPAVLVREHQVLGGGDVDARAEEVGADRQLPSVARGEHCEAHRARPAEIEELVQRRADRAARVQHVVDQDHLAAVDGKRNLAAPRFAVQPDAAEVVAVQRHGEESERGCEAERAMQPLGDPRAPGVDADQRRIGRDLAAHLLGHRAHQCLGIRQRHGDARRDRRDSSAR